ncbi:MAG: hypothetical protein QW210_01180 [Candidatus Woesearchaeota archaeon]
MASKTLKIFIGVAGLFTGISLLFPQTYTGNFVNQNPSFSIFSYLMILASFLLILVASSESETSEKKETLENIVDESIDPDLEKYYSLAKKISESYEKAIVPKYDKEQIKVDLFNLMKGNILYYEENKEKMKRILDYLSANKDKELAELVKTKIDFLQKELEYMINYIDDFEYSLDKDKKEMNIKSKREELLKELNEYYKKVKSKLQY